MIARAAFQNDLKELQQDIADPYQVHLESRAGVGKLGIVRILESC